MAKLVDIVTFLNDLLKIDQYADYCPNGLQVEGRSEVSKVITGVTASQALIDSAIDEGADIILVHHGYFWRGESQAITGIKKNRIKKLLQQDVSLLAYHLPLDGHKELGNNAQLAEKLGLTVQGWFGPEGKDICLQGELKIPMSSEQFSNVIHKALSRKPLHIGATENKTISSVALCTGGAQSYFEAAIAKNVDAYITGEVSEQCFHLAKETGVDYFSAGHHATERYGVLAIGNLLTKNFSVDHKFLDVDNPV